MPDDLGYLDAEIRKRLGIEDPESPPSYEVIDYRTVRLVHVPSGWERFKSKIGHWIKGD